MLGIFLFRNVQLMMMIALHLRSLVRRHRQNQWWMLLKLGILKRQMGPPWKRLRLLMRPMWKHQYLSLPNDYHANGPQEQGLELGVLEITPLSYNPELWNKLIYRLGLHQDPLAIVVQSLLQGQVQRSGSLPDLHTWDCLAQGPPLLHLAKPIQQGKPFTT